jgi:hypothetical protein
VRNHQIAKNSTAPKAREKMSTVLKSLVFLTFLIYASLNLKPINFYLIKLSTDFYWQPSYLLGKRASWVTHPFSKKNGPAYSATILTAVL